MMFELMIAGDHPPCRFAEALGALLGLPAAAAAVGSRRWSAGRGMQT